MVAARHVLCIMNIGPIDGHTFGASRSHTRCQLVVVTLPLIVPGCRSVFAWVRVVAQLWCPPRTQNPCASLIPTSDQTLSSDLSVLSHVVGEDMKRLFRHNPRNIMAGLVSDMTFHRKVTLINVKVCQAEAFCCFLCPAVLCVSISL